MKISIIGAGNVAYHLGKALLNVGHTILSVNSPTEANRKELASELLAEPLDINPFHIPDATEVVLIAVRDDVLKVVADSLEKKNYLVLHTSGTQPMSMLDAFPNHGVLYPLQTLSRQKAIDYKQLPLCIEANGEGSWNMLHKLASTINRSFHEVNSDKRKVLHIAAVFCCNFTNHLYNIAGNIVAAEELDFDLLRPLIAETSEKVMHHLPEEMQTGPAVRSDQAVMNQHLDYLKDHPEWREIYKLMSEDILKSQDNIVRLHQE